MIRFEWFQNPTSIVPEPLIRLGANHSIDLCQDLLCHALNVLDLVALGVRYDGSQDVEPVMAPALACHLAW